MASYFRSSLGEFLCTSDSEVLARLTLGYARDGFSQMHAELPLTWWDDLSDLREVVERLVVGSPRVSQWEIVLEFSVPRKQRRLDVVILCGAKILLLECKRGPATGEAIRQVEEYALLLHYFHKPSHNRHIYPVLISAELSPSGTVAFARQAELQLETLPSFWIAPTVVCAWGDVASLLARMAEEAAEVQDGEAWDDGQYFPTPTIIEAALALRSGLQIGDIAHSEASEFEIDAVAETIRTLVSETQSQGGRAICFLTGVPGSGKTLVGLSLAHLGEDRNDAIHFMSGNGPLVGVLQELFRRQAMRDGVPAAAARTHAQTLIENVHVFAREYSDEDVSRPPYHHVVIFDEAQRAWNLKQNLRKFARNYSEPEMLLGIMERHQDWSVVIALVGGGQEIHDGEAGLEEWGKAIAASQCDWQVFASPEVIAGGESTAGHRLFDGQSAAVTVQERSTLHLRTSNRSLRADNLARWVNLVLGGDCAGAAGLKVTERYPILLTRSLDRAKECLRAQSIGESRYGLAASSGAARLRAEGLEPSSDFHGAYPWHHWYLAPQTDVRSSFQCEVFATEFEIQGLELDWIGLCWGGDFIWSGGRWVGRDLRHGLRSKWGLIRSDEKMLYRRNAYRVLLTRARQGMVIYVPAGSVDDQTRQPKELDETADYLLRCGVLDYEVSRQRAKAAVERQAAGVEGLPSWT